MNKIICCKNDNNLKNICLSEDNKYLFTACSNENNIKIIDLNQKKIITCIKVNTKNLFSIKRIKHNIYGSCILTKGELNDNIKLWIP